MRAMKLVVAGSAVVMIAGLAGCASTGEAPSLAARHQHLRDAKQGPAASALASSDQPAPKLLHDHREMK